MRVDKSHPLQGPGLLLLVMLAVLPEVINSSLSGVAEAYINGSLSLSSDEGSWITLGYLMAKMAVFPLAAWCSQRLGAFVLLRWSASAVMLATLLPLLWHQYHWHLLWRMVQGGAGGLVLIAAQLLLVQGFSRRRQGLVQSVYAMAVVVLPMTLLPAIMGEIVVNLDWRWCYGLALATGFPALLALALVRPGATFKAKKRPFDWLGALLLGPALAILTYVLAEGARYNWFDAPHIRTLSLLSIAMLAGAVWHLSQARKNRRLLNIAVFTNPSFGFAFPVSHLAGYILFGSGFLIPALAVGALGFNAADAGHLLLPSALPLTLALLLGGSLISKKELDPTKLVPLGLGLMVAAIWLLAQSSPQSGFADMWPAVMIRGAAMGFLFIAVTVIALSRLEADYQADGVVLFNLGRQLGGILGLSSLNRFLDHEVAQNTGVLAPELNASAVNQLGEQLGGLAEPVMEQVLKQQIWVLAVDDAFISLIALIFGALPLVIGLKVLQKKTGWTH